MFVWKNQTIIRWRVWPVNIYEEKIKKPQMLKIIQSKFTDAWVDISVADPDPGSGAFLTLGSGSEMGKKSGSRSGINNPDHIFKSLETISKTKFESRLGTPEEALYRTEVMRIIRVVWVVWI
jgi:hypothetical protein